MISYLKEVPTAQHWLITLAQCPMPVALVTLQAPPRQLLATGMTGESCRVLIVLKRECRRDTRAVVQVQGRMFEVVITAHRLLAAGGQAHVESLD